MIEVRQHVGLPWHGRRDRRGAAAPDTVQTTLGQLIVRWRTSSRSPREAAARAASSAPRGSAPALATRSSPRCSGQRSAGPTSAPARFALGRADTVTPPAEIVEAAQRVAARARRRRPDAPLLVISASRVRAARHRPTSPTDADDRRSHADVPRGRSPGRRRLHVRRRRPLPREARSDRVLFTRHGRPASAPRPRSPRWPAGWPTTPATTRAHISTSSVPCDSRPPR